MLGGGLVKGMGAGALMGADDDDDDGDGEDMEKIRHWELTMLARSFRYVGTNSTIDTFLVISLVPEDVKNRQVKLKLPPQYSPAIILTKDEDYSLTTPWILYNKKTFSYLTKISRSTSSKFQCGRFHITHSTHTTVLAHRTCGKLPRRILTWI